MAKAPGRSSAASAPSGQGATAGTGKGTGGAAAAAGATGSNSANNLPLAAKVAEVLFLLMEKRNEDLLRVPDEKGCSHTWLYSNGLWSLLADPTEWLDHRIEMTLREMKCSSKSKGHFIAEARRYIERSPNVRPKGSMAWDAHGKVPTRSGLIDPVTLKCEPFKKEHYATWLIDVDYDPAAKCPLWEEMLGDYFPTHSADEREQRVVLLQDFSGTMLIDQLSKTLKRALVPYGPSDTGKSTLMRVLWRMITVKPISVAFADVSGPHGLEEFTRRAPWVLDEAFNVSGWHLSDKVKSIISRETLSINQKNLRLITMPINAPCMWGTNHPPTFKENTDALVNRLLILPLKRIFKKGELVGVAAKAKAVNSAWEPDDLIHDREKAGVLNWMLAGLQRLLMRGNFANTAEGEAALDEMKLEANPVAGFLRDCIRFNPDMMVSSVDFHAAFFGWWEEMHGDRKANIDARWIGRYLSALAHPWLLQNNQAYREDDGKRFYLGIALNKAGRAYFDAEKSERHHGRPTGSVRRMSETGSKANLLIPAKWLSRPEVVKLRMNGPPVPGSE